MSSHFYVNSLIVLPLKSSELAIKEVQTPFYILFPQYVVQVHAMFFWFLCSYSRSFPNFWIGTMNKFLRELFQQFLIAIFLMSVLVQILDMSQERGSGHCILDQIQTRMFCPSILPLKMVEYPVAARRWVWEPICAMYRPIRNRKI